MIKDFKKVRKELEEELKSCTILKKEVRNKDAVTIFDWTNKTIIISKHMLKYHSNEMDPALKKEFKLLEDLSYAIFDLYVEKEDK